MKIVEGLPPRTTGLVAIDLEIFKGYKPQLHRPHGDFACLQICEGDTVYLLTRPAQVEKALHRIDRAIWVFHNASFDIRHLRRWAEILPRDGTHFHDTLLVDKILYLNYYDNFALPDLCRRWLHVRMDKDVREDFINGSVLTERMKDYAANDVAYTWEIAKKQLEACPISPTWNMIDCPAFWAILDFQGFRIDEKRWLHVAHDEQTRANEIRGKAGFNPGSSPQTIAALEKKGIHLESSKEEFLLPYRDEPLVQTILGYREAAKRASTYGAKFIAESVEADEKVWAEFNVIGAETGRMSCSSPNLQNIPVRDTKIYRECFIASRGHRLIIADYNQQEPRIAAELTRDHALLEVFESGGDSHLAVARAIYHDNTLTKEKDKAKRGVGKTVNLGLLYGLTEYGLEKRGIPRSDARAMVTNYFNTFRGVGFWINRTRVQALENEGVYTLGGRHVWVNPYSRQAENNAINSPVQGSAADMTKRALSLLHHACREVGLPYPVVGAIHDEIILDAPRKEITRYKRMLSTAMNQAFVSLCPHVSTKHLVEISVGRTWADKQ